MPLWIMIAVVGGAVIFVAAFTTARRARRDRQAQDATFEYFKGADSAYRDAPLTSAAIILAGDSIAQRFPASEYLGVPVLNRGISGETSEQLTWRIPELRRHHPKILIVISGANDVKNHVPTSETLRNLHKLVGIAQKTLILGVLPGSPDILDPKAVKALDDALSTWGAVYVAPPAGWDWRADTFDGLHPNGDPGYRLIAAEIKKRI